MVNLSDKRVLVEGSLFRESNVVSDIVNWRHGALFDQGPFVTFRQAPPGGAGACVGPDSAPQPTKVSCKGQRAVPEAWRWRAQRPPHVPPPLAGLAAVRELLRGARQRARVHSEGPAHQHVLEHSSGAQHQAQPVRLQAALAQVAHPGPR